MNVRTTLLTLTLCGATFGGGYGFAKAMDPLREITAYGNSMGQTIRNGDKLIVNYDHKDEIHKRDIIICESSEGTIVKRVIGEPGDFYCQNGRRIQIPPRHYFVMGDGENSLDSRHLGLLEATAKVLEIIPQNQPDAVIDWSTVKAIPATFYISN